MLRPLVNLQESLVDLDPDAAHDDCIAANGRQRHHDGRGAETVSFRKVISAFATTDSTLERFGKVR